MRIPAPCHGCAVWALRWQLYKCLRSKIYRVYKLQALDKVSSVSLSEYNVGDVAYSN